MRKHKYGLSSDTKQESQTGDRESDHRIVPMKGGNALGGKAMTYPSSLQGTHLPHPEVKGKMETKLARIAEIAKERGTKERFTSLAQLINEESLIGCHKELRLHKASGVDGVTKAMYEKDLVQNVGELIERMKKQSYKPQPVRRVYIAKPGRGKMRPLGIPAYEDKLVQSALAKILNAVYEPYFIGSSYGFRPGRSPHDGLKALTQAIEKGKVSYVVDADIEGFFDHVDHEWMKRFIAHRIADPNIVRLIARFLKSGVIEATSRYDTPQGTPQGGPVSPILANIYLHYALDLWFEAMFKKRCRGKAYMVRFADDFVCCFQYKDDARRFLQALTKRLAKFDLKVAEEKTKIIAFGRFAEDRAKREGKRKTDTFDFLGFTHYCGKSRYGKFRVKHKTSCKSVRLILSRMSKWLKANRNKPARQLMAELCLKLVGIHRYYGITDNLPALSMVGDKTGRLLYKWMNRRSQRKSFSWDKFSLFLNKYPLPTPKIFVNIYDIRPGLAGLSP